MPVADCLICNRMRHHPEIRIAAPLELRRAYAGSGLTLDALADGAGLEGVRSTILRKITGRTKMSEDELLRVAKFFGFTVSWDRRRNFTLTKAA